jgi:acyl carrier protein
MAPEIRRRLAGHIASQILKKPDRSLSDDEPLLSSGLIDSFHLMDLAMLVEDHFGVRIEDSELNSETFDTVGELADLIERRAKA